MNENLHALQGPGYDRAVFANHRSFFLGISGGSGFSNCNDSAVRPSRRGKLGERVRNFVGVEDVDLVVGDVEKAHAICAHDEVGILPFI